MNSIQTSIIIMLLIIIIACTLSSYKIETFAQDIPETPNDLSAYNFLLKVKNWDVTSLQKEHLLVLLTMRALQVKKYNQNSREFPYLNGVVIPYMHLPLFNKDPAAKTPIIFEIADGLKNITANPTDEEMSPEGLYINLNTTSFQDFKDVLEVLYQEYDSEFIEELENLKQRKAVIENEYKPFEVLLSQLEEDLKIQTNLAKDAKAKYDKELAISKELENEMTKYRACG